MSWSRCHNVNYDNILNYVIISYHVGFIQVALISHTQ